MLRREVPTAPLVAAIETPERHVANVGERFQAAEPMSVRVARPMAFDAPEREPGAVSVVGRHQPVIERICSNAVMTCTMSPDAIARSAAVSA